MKGRRSSIHDSVRLIILRNEHSGENQIAAQVYDESTKGEWINADLIISPEVCFGLTTENEADPSSVSYKDEFMLEGIQNHCSFKVSWSSARKGQTRDATTQRSAPRVYVQAGLDGGGQFLSVHKARVKFEDGLAEDNAEEHIDPVVNTQYEDESTIESKDSTEETAQGDGAADEGDKAPIATDEQERKDPKLPFFGVKKEFLRKLDTSENMRHPTNTLALAYQFRFGGLQKPKILIGYIIRSALKIDPLTTRHISEIGLLARTYDIDICSQLWRIATRKDADDLHGVPHYIRCLAEILLFSDASGHKSQIEKVIEKIVGKISEYQEMQAKRSKDEHQIQFLVHSLGFLLDSVILKRLKVDIPEASQKVLTNFLLESRLSRSPQYNHIFEKAYQGLIRILNSSESFPTNYMRPQRYESVCRTLSELRNIVLKEYNASKCTSDPTHKREYWYDNYIFFKSLILAHRLEDAVVFSDHILARDKSSEFLFFVLEDFVRIAQLPVKACSKESLQYIEKLVSDEFMTAQKPFYGHHAIYQLRKLAQSEIHSKSVRNILQNKNEEFGKSVFISLVEQELGKHLERINASGIITSEHHLPTDLLYQAQEAYSKIFAMRGQAAESEHIRKDDQEDQVDYDEIYVLLKAKKSFNDERTLDADSVVDHFLKGHPSTLVILGKSGAGKSTFAKKLFERLRARGSQKSHPIFINLPAVDEPKKLKEYVEKNMKSDHDRLSESAQAVFIMDGYDELKEAGKINIISENWKFLKKYHIIITYRYNMQESKHDLQRIFGAGKDKRASPIQFMIIQPFGDDQVKEYIKLFVESQPKIAFSSKELISKVISSPSLKESAESPFILSLIMRVLPKYMEEKKMSSEENISRYDIYDRFIDYWHQSREKSSKDDNLFNREKYAEYSMRLAQKLIEQDTTVATLKKSGSDQKSQFEWGTFFEDTYKLTEIRKGTLVRRFNVSENEEQYGFIHRSIQEFFGAKKAIQEVEDGTWSEKASSIFSNLKDKDFLVKQFMADYAFRNKTFQQKLNEIIQSSRKSKSKTNENELKSQRSMKQLNTEAESISVGDSGQSIKLFTSTASTQITYSTSLQDLKSCNANAVHTFHTTPVIQTTSASIAITILNYAKIPIHQKNWNGIDIPKADLSQAILQNVDFSDANLSQVSFVDADLRGCKFDGAKMEKTNFGQLPRLIHTAKVSGGCVDVNGDFVQFYTASERNVNVWDLQTCESNVQMAHKANISSMALIKKNDDSYLIAGDNTGAITIWDAVLCEAKVEIPSTKLNSGQIMCVAHNIELQAALKIAETDDILFVHASMDGALTFCLYNPKITYQNPFDILIKQVVLPGQLNSVDFFFVGEKAYIVYGGSLSHIQYQEITFNTETKKVALGDPRKLETKNSQVSAIRTIKYQNRYKIAASINKDICIFDTDCLSDPSVYLASYHEKVIRDIQWIPSDDAEPEFIVSSGGDKMVYIWNVSEGSVAYPLFGHTKEVSKLSVFKYMSDYYILGCCQDSSAWIWSVRSKEFVKKASGHHKAINTVSAVFSTTKTSERGMAFYPKMNESTNQWDKSVDKIISSSGMVVTGSSDRSLKVWDFATGNCLVTRKMGDLVPRLTARKIGNRLGVYYQLNNSKKDVMFFDPFDPFDPDSTPQSVVSNSRHSITHFDHFNIDGTDFLIVCSNSQLTAHKLSSTSFDKAENSDPTVLVDGKVVIFSLTTSEIFNANIIVTIENGAIICRRINYDSHSGKIIFSTEDEIAQIVLEVDLSTPLTPVFTKTNPNLGSLSAIVGDENGLLYRFDFPVDGKEAAQQQLLYDGETPVYGYDTFELEGIEYAAFGDRDGFLRVVEVWNDEEYDRNIIFEKQIHNQVRAVRYHQDTNTLITTGENGFMYLWTPLVVKDGKRKRTINLLVVWTTHSTLRGDEAKSEGMKSCSQPNRLLMDQLKSPPIIED